MKINKELIEKAKLAYNNGDFKLAKILSLKIYRNYKNQGFTEYILNRVFSSKDLDDVLLILASIFFKEGFFKKALTFIKQISKLTLEVEVLLLMILIELKEKKEIKKLNIKACLILLSEDENALSYLKRLFDLIDDPEIRWHILLEIYNRAPDFSKDKIKDLTKYIDVNEITLNFSEWAYSVTNDGGLKYKIASYFVENNIVNDDSFKYVKEIYRIKKESKFLYFLALYYIKKGIYSKESLSILKEAYKRFPNDLKILGALARVLRKLKIEDEFTIEILKKIYNLNLKDTDSIKQLALIYAKQKNYSKEALKLYKMVYYYLENERIFVESACMAFLYNSIFDKDSLELAKRAVKFDEENILFKFLLGASNIYVGYREVGLNILREIKENFDTDISEFLVLYKTILYKNEMKICKCDYDELKMFYGDLLSIYSDNNYYEYFETLADIIFSKNFDRYNCDIENKSCVYSQNIKCAVERYKKKLFKDQDEIMNMIRYYLTALEKKRLPYIYFKLGRAYYYIGYHQSAFDALKQALDIKENVDITIVCFFARLLYQKRDFEGIKKLLIPWYERDKGALKILEFILIACYNTNDIDAGIELASQGIERFPQYYGFYFWRARFYKKNNWLKIARYDFERAYFLNSNEETAIGLSEIYLEYGKYQKCNEILANFYSKKALKIRFKALDNMKNSEASLLNLINLYLEKYGDDVEMLYKYIEIMWPKEKSQRIIDIYDKIISLNPSQSIRKKVIKGKAYCYFEIREYKLSLNILIDNLYLFNKEDIEINRLLAKLYEKFNQYREVVERISYIPIKAWIPEDYILCAHALKFTQSIDRAINLLKEGFEIFPDNWEIIFKLAKLSEEIGRLKDAREYYQILYQLKDDTDAITSLIKVYYKFKAYLMVIELIKSNNLQNRFHDLLQKAYYYIGDFKSITNYSNLHIDEKKVNNLLKKENILVLEAHKNLFLITRIKGDEHLCSISFGINDEEVIADFLCEGDKLLIRFTDYIPSILSEMRDINFKNIIISIFPHLDYDDALNFIKKHYPDTNMWFSFKKFFMHFNKNTQLFLLKTDIVPRDLFKIDKSNFYIEDFINDDYSNIFYDGEFKENIGVSLEKFKEFYGCMALYKNIPQVYEYNLDLISNIFNSNLNDLDLYVAMWFIVVFRLPYTMLSGRYRAYARLFIKKQKYFFNNTDCVFDLKSFCIYFVNVVHINIEELYFLFDIVLKFKNFKGYKHIKKIFKDIKYIIEIFKHDFILYKNYFGVYKKQRELSFLLDRLLKIINNITVNDKLWFDVFYDDIQGIKKIIKALNEGDMVYIGNNIIQVCDLNKLKNLNIKEKKYDFSPDNAIFYWYKLINSGLKELNMEHDIIPDVFISDENRKIVKRISNKNSVICIKQFPLLEFLLDYPDSLIILFDENEAIEIQHILYANTGLYVPILKDINDFNKKYLRAMLIWKNEIQRSALDFLMESYFDKNIFFEAERLIPGFKGFFYSYYIAFKNIKDDYILISKLYNANKIKEYLLLNSVTVENYNENFYDLKISIPKKIPEMTSGIETNNDMLTYMIYKHNLGDISIKNNGYKIFIKKE